MSKVPIESVERPDYRRAFCHLCASPSREIRLAQRILEDLNMKIKKTVSEKLHAANRKNAQKSARPVNVAFVRDNALEHGLRAKRIVFENDKERDYANS